MRARDVNLEVTDCHFIDNYSDDYGGGISWWGLENHNAEIRGTSFKNNGANQDSGGLEVDGAVAISHCSFFNNTSGEGGALGIYSGNVSVDHSNFTRNIGGGVAQGGGIYHTGAMLTVTNSIFDGNAAEGFVMCSAGGDGGAAFISSDSNGASFVNSTFVGNTADGDGGAVYAGSTSSPVTFDGCSFFNNTNTAGGGGFECAPTAGAVLIAKGFFTECMFFGNAAPEGGAIAITTGKVTISNCQITDNHATDYFSGGGGIQINSNAEVIINHTIISNDTASGDGGGIKVNSGALITNDCQITGNSASDSGGGLHFRSFTEEVMISDTTISSNTAQFGGGIKADGGALIIDDCQCTGNSASQDGGCLWTKTETNLNGTSFIGNTADDEGDDVYIPSFYGDPPVCGSGSGNLFKDACNDTKAFTISTNVPTTTCEGAETGNNVCSLPPSSQPSALPSDEPSAQPSMSPSNATSPS